MYVNKLWCHNCHIAIIAVLSEKATKRNNWDTPSNRLRRRRSDAFRASSLLVRRIWIYSYRYLRRISNILLLLIIIIINYYYYYYCLETSCISFSFLFRVKMPRLVLSLPQRPFCAVGKLGRRKCGRGGREVGEGEGWWGAHADSAVATPPLVSLWNDVVISRGSRWWRSEMSPGFSGHGE